MLRAPIKMTERDARAPRTPRDNTRTFEHEAPSIPRPARSRLRAAAARRRPVPCAATAGALISAAPPPPRARATGPPLRPSEGSQGTLIPWRGEGVRDFGRSA